MLQAFAEGAEGGFMYAHHPSGHFVMLSYGFEQQVGQEAELVARIRCEHAPAMRTLRHLWEARVGRHVHGLTNN